MNRIAASAPDESLSMTLTLDETSSLHPDESTIPVSVECSNRSVDRSPVWPARVRAKELRMGVKNIILSQIAGKSNGELSRAFENTVAETKHLSIVVAPAPERSPTAINVAQIWANAAQALDR